MNKIEPIVAMCVRMTPLLARDFEHPVVKMLAALAGVLVGGRVSVPAFDGVVGVLMVAGLALSLTSAQMPARATVRATRAH